MRRPWWLVILLGGAVAAAVSADGGPAEGRLLDRLRADPEHYQRLRRDLIAFHALPRQRQKQMRQLDRDLHTGDVTRRTHLLGVLDRYAAWLDHLPEADRRRVAGAVGPDERLAVIRELRDRQWVERLPSKTREELFQAPPEKRGQMIASLREEERRSRRAWLGRDNPRLRPVRMEHFPPEVQAFFQGLSPRFSVADQQRLRQAEGRWPDFAKAVLELAESYPVLPPLPSGPITRWRELPREVELRLSGVEKQRKVKLLRLNAPIGWPMFAEFVARFLRQEKLPAPPLGASRLSEMPAEVQAVVKERLLPLLAPRQREALQKAEGHWPDYPQHLLRLARDRGIVLPGMSLPGPPELWESVRLALHDVPDRVLMRFARHEASEADPVRSREKVQREWYRKQLAEQRRRGQAE